MKKPLMITIIILVVIVGGYIVYDQVLDKDGNADNDADNDKTGIDCPDYDGDQSGCLSHSGCGWNSDINLCDSTDTIDEDNGGDEGLNQELENIAVPNNLSNELCKKLPLSNQPPYSERYYCLALVNHDERFCQGIDEEKAKNICLAHANADASYCEKVKNQESKHVCYYMLAVSSENAAFCDDIDYLDTAEENINEQEQCYYGFMSNLYQWGQSDEITTEICGHLGGEMEKTCLALKARDVSMCGDNPNCLTHFEQPISFCDERPDFPSCIKDRAKTNKDVSICELLPQPDRDSCVGVYCTHTELDAAICDTIENIEERQDRYMELAMNLANL
ncbi:MAG: hypothetical protein V1853_05550 [bacterium]